MTKRYPPLMLSEVQKSAVFGTILGDGCLYVPESEWNEQGRLILSHSLEQKEFFMYKYSMLRPYMGSVSVIKNGGWGGFLIRSSSLTHPYWTELYHLVYKNRRKAVSLAWLEEISHPIGLAVWYMDDGGRTGGTRGLGKTVQIATNDFTFEENALLVNWLHKRWGVSGHVAPDIRHGQWFIMLDHAGRDRLFDLIRLFVPPSMLYKLLDPVPIATCGSCGRQFVPSRFQAAIMRNGLKVMCSPECKVERLRKMARLRWKHKEDKRDTSTTLT